MKAFYLTAFAFLMMLGCATVKPLPITMLPGKMFSLKDGTELQLSVEFAVNSGKMIAYNPKTQENFTGQYTGIYTGSSVSESASTNAWGNTYGKVTTVTGPTGAKVRGILKGDKGTIIDISMDVQPGNLKVLPKGFGEGIDNHGVKYQVQF